MSHQAVPAKRHRSLAGRRNARDRRSGRSRYSHLRRGAPDGNVDADVLLPALRSLVSPPPSWIRPFMPRSGRTWSANSTDRQYCSRTMCREAGAGRLGTGEEKHAADDSEGRTGVRKVRRWSGRDRGDGRHPRPHFCRNRTDGRPTRRVGSWSSVWRRLPVSDAGCPRPPVLTSLLSGRASSYPCTSSANQKKFLPGM